MHTAAVSAAPGAAPSAQGPGVASTCARLCVRVVLCCFNSSRNNKAALLDLAGAAEKGVCCCLESSAPGRGWGRRSAAGGRGCGAGGTEGAHTEGPCLSWAGPGRAGWQRQPGASRRTSQKLAPVCFTPPACTFSERLPPWGLSGADVAAHPCPPSRKDPRSSAQHGRSGTGSPGRDGAGRDGAAAPCRAMP